MVPLVEQVGGELEVRPDVPGPVGRHEGAAPRPREGHGVHVAAADGLDVHGAREGPTQVHGHQEHVAGGEMGLADDQVHKVQGIVGHLQDDAGGDVGVGHVDGEGVKARRQAPGHGPLQVGLAVQLAGGPVHEAARGVVV